MAPGCFLFRTEQSPNSGADLGKEKTVVNNHMGLPRAPRIIYRKCITYVIKY